MHKFVHLCVCELSRVLATEQHSACVRRQLLCPSSSAIWFETRVNARQTANCLHLALAHRGL